ncbi:MAG: hypothetical protein ACO200_02140 [Steroidobacteraceae bacterium]
MHPGDRGGLLPAWLHPLGRGGGGGGGGVGAAVGDRAPGPHEANLFDLQAKYAEVVPLEVAVSYVTAISAGKDQPAT